MNKELMEQVLEANRKLVESNIANPLREFVSAIDREENVVFFPGKREKMGLQDIITVDIENGTGKYAIHTVLYRKNVRAASILQSQKKYTMCFSQLKENIPPLNTIHSGRFFGEIPCIDKVPYIENDEKYEDKLADNVMWKLEKYIPGQMPAIIVPFEGAICFGNNPVDSYELSMRLENIAEIALLTRHFCGGCYEYMPLQLMQGTWNMGE